MVGDIIYMKKNKNSKSLIKKSVFYFILFLIFFELGLYLIFNSFDIGRNENVSYTEEGNVDYSVCLNKNEFYESQCLNKNMSYVAGLIDNIPINFSYNFSFNDDKVIDNLEYEIIGKLVIYSNDTSTSYYEKEYVLKNKTSEGVIKQSDYYSFSDNVDIDYGYYNEIATKFKSQYGVDASSYLEVYLNVYKDSSLKNNISPSKISINIPLSQRSIEIKINSEEINRSQKQTIVNNEFSFSNLSGFIIGIILTIIISNKIDYNPNSIKDDTFTVTDTEIVGNSKIYYVTSQGFGGKKSIKSKITMENNNIVEIISSKDSYMGMVLDNNYIDTIINNQNNLDNLDTISGCTYTSKYLKEIVEKTKEDYNK